MCFTIEFIIIKIYIYFFSKFLSDKTLQQIQFFFCVGMCSRHCPLYMYTYVAVTHIHTHVHSLSSLVSFRFSSLFFPRRSLLYDVTNVPFIATREKRCSSLSRYSVNPRNIFSSQCFLSIREIFYISPSNSFLLTRTTYAWIE